MTLYYSINFFIELVKALYFLITGCMAFFKLPILKQRLSGTPALFTANFLFAMGVHSCCLSLIINLLSYNGQIIVEYSILINDFINLQV